MSRKESDMGKLKTHLPEKYKYRYEQILNIIAISGEAPFDLYNYIDITKNTYQKTIHELKSKGYIKTINTHNINGYVLTLDGKRYLRNESSLRLTFADIRGRTSDPKLRKRCHSFAVLYATFDKLGIQYEPSKKPQRNVHSMFDNRLIFYSAAEYKAEAGERGATFKGSRSQGIIVGKGIVYPVYIMNQRLIEFNISELGFVNQIGKDYYNGGEISNAIIFCTNTNAISGIIDDFINFEKNGKGENILHSSYYKDALILPLDDKLLLSFKTLYNYEKLKNILIRQLKINTENTYYQSDGIINQNENVIFMFTMTVAKLTTFISINKRTKSRGHIICYDFLAPIIKKYITAENSITVKIIKAEDVMRLLS